MPKPYAIGIHEQTGDVVCFARYSDLKVFLRDKFGAAAVESFGPEFSSQGECTLDNWCIKKPPYAIAVNRDTGKIETFGVAAQVTAFLNARCKPESEAHPIARRMFTEGRCDFTNTKEIEKAGTTEEPIGTRWQLVYTHEMMASRVATAL